jgi:hypothetical protein
LPDAGFAEAASQALPGSPSMSAARRDPPLDEDCAPEDLVDLYAEQSSDRDEVVHRGLS